MAYEIIKKFISQNRSGINLNAKGTVAHETADPGASDENEQAYFNNGYRGASAHAFVDYDSITQTIPWNERAWHAGPTANSSFIGIEFCHYDDATRFNEVWKRAVWLFAYVHVNVLNITKITSDNLMSHAEVSLRWHETDHMDPVSYFKQFGKTVNDFRNEVQNEINLMLNIGKVDNMSILDLQKLCNKLGITDYEGKALSEDNEDGPKTQSAKKKLKSILQYVLA